MRPNHFLLKMVFLCLFLLSGPTSAHHEIIYVLAGQSNMAGHGKRSKLPAQYRRNPPNVSYYYNGYKTPLNHFAHIGPEIGFAHEVSRRFPKHHIKIIKFAVGGTSMLAWAPHWTAARANLTRNASAGPLFKKLLQTVNASYDKKMSRISAVLWMQGEADAKYPAVARNYTGNLRNFVVSLRRNLDNRATQFVVAGINPPLKHFPAANQVLRAQHQVVASLPNMRFVSTMDLSKRSDKIHYDTAGLLKLGQRFGRVVSP